MLTSETVSPDESERALRNGAVAAQATRDVIEVDGPEATGYLQGQISQNAERLVEGASAWTLLLEPNGRVTAWGRVTRVGPETFWLDTDVAAGAATLERLQRFKLRTKATFTLHQGVATVIVRGPMTPSVADLQSVLDDDLAGHHLGAGLDRVRAVRLDWPSTSGVDLLGLDLGAPGVADALSAAGMVLGDPSIVELERVEAGRPAMGHEFGEKTIPAETGVVELSADFTKGCYVGQELVARIDSRGSNTPRSVHPVRLAGGIRAKVGDELLLDGEPVGVLTSVAAATDHVAALASIKRGVEAPVDLAVEVDGAMVVARVEPPHWTSRRSS